MGLQTTTRPCKCVRSMLDLQNSKRITFLKQREKSHCTKFIFEVYPTQDYFNKTTDPFFP